MSSPIYSTRSSEPSCEGRQAWIAPPSPPLMRPREGARPCHHTLKILHVPEVVDFTARRDPSRPYAADVQTLQGKPGTLPNQPRPRAQWLSSRCSSASMPASPQMARGTMRPGTMRLACTGGAGAAVLLATEVSRARPLASGGEKRVSICEGGIESLDLRRCQPPARGAAVLRHAVYLVGFGDGNHMGMECAPVQRNLGWGFLDFRSYLL